MKMKIIVKIESTNFFIRSIFFVPTPMELTAILELQQADNQTGKQMKRQVNERIERQT
jgi:hypothetical protein